MRLDPVAYQRHLAGRPREVGAAVALELAGLPADAAAVAALCQAKQQVFERLLGEDRVRVYPDAVRLLVDCRELGVLIAAASASRNATGLLAQVAAQAEGGTPVGALYDCEPFVGAKPEAFASAASSLGLPADACTVIEDASAGVAAAKEAGFRCVGVARGYGSADLAAAGADLVVDTLDEWPRPHQSALPSRRQQTEAASPLFGNQHM